MSFWKSLGSGHVRSAALAGALAAAVAGVLFPLTFDRNITGFFRIGDVLPLSPFIQPGAARIFPEQVGYDGQQFLTIALDPALRSEGTTRALDNPRYRYRRIGYPLAGYLLGLGRPGLVPYALVALNLLSIAGLALLVSLYRSDDGPDTAPPPSALGVLAIPGVWVCLCLTTADLFGSFLFTGGLLCLKRRRHVPAAVLLCVACLTRETYLATVAALAGLMFVQRRPASGAWILLGALPPLGWLVFASRYAQGGTSGFRENLSLPFTGIIAKFQDIAARGIGGVALFEAFCFMLLLLAAGLAAAMAIRRRALPDVACAALLSCLAILGVSKMQILVYHANFLRIFMDVWIILLLLPASRWHGYARALLLALSCMASLAYTINYIIS